MSNQFSLVKPIHLVCLLNHCLENIPFCLLQWILEPQTDCKTSQGQELGSPSLACAFRGSVKKLEGYWIIPCVGAQVRAKQSCVCTE